MYDEKRELISSYRAMPETLGVLLQDVTDDETATRRGDTEWSIGEIVCHLLDAEQRTFERVTRIRDEDQPTLPVYPDDEYRGRSLARTLEAFDRLRNEHARLLGNLGREAWSRTGRHEAQGELSILDITRHMAAHDAEHLAQIARQLRRDRPAPAQRHGRSRNARRSNGPGPAHQSRTPALP